jgi:hypothetical protein
MWGGCRRNWGCGDVVCRVVLDLNLGGEAFETRRRFTGKVERCGSTTQDD